MRVQRTIIITSVLTRLRMGQSFDTCTAIGLLHHFGGHLLNTEHKKSRALNLKKICSGEKIASCLRDENVMVKT